MPQPRIHRLLKQCQRTKINKAMLSALKCLWISKGRKSETAMAHKNRMDKYLANTTSQNKSCLMRQLKSRQEKDAISVSPKQDFMPQPIIHRPLKQCQRTKTNKAMLSAFNGLWISMGKKSETTMAHKSRMNKYIADTTSRKKTCLLRQLISRKEKDIISAGPK